MLGREVPELMKMLIKEQREDSGLELKGIGSKELPSDAFVSFPEFTVKKNNQILRSYFQVPNPFGEGAGKGINEGANEDEWIVQKDKEPFTNTNI